MIVNCGQVIIWGQYIDGLRAGRPGFDFRHAKDMSPFSNASRSVTGSTQSPIQRVPESLSSVVKRPGSEAEV
jgi:hypothetical protein